MSKNKRLLISALSTVLLLFGIFSYGASLNIIPSAEQSSPATQVVASAGPASDPGVANEAITAAQYGDDDDQEEDDD